MRKTLTGIALMLLFCVYSICDCVAAEKQPILKRVGHVVKKTVMLPVYLVGGAGFGAILWWQIGGQEDELKDAFKGYAGK